MTEISVEKLDKREGKDIILHGDVFACLEHLDSPIAVAVTSPPYWKQRDYGFEGQIGQERTSEKYIGHLVTVFGKLREKLREDGIFFLNIGDKYRSKYGKSNLLQIPYRLAHHMVKNGWHLVDIIIWFKPNHMPSPVKDRFSNTYEPILVFSKSKENIYKKGLKNVVKIPLQQTPWKHTAVFPEMLVEEMLNRVSINDGDIILDPFAGTGTVAVVVKKLRGRLCPLKIFSIMIEKGDEFIPIIQKRAKIKNMKKISDLFYEWKVMKDEKIPDVKHSLLLSDKSGEVFIAENSNKFLSTLRGILNPKSIQFHREDALYFLGVKDWSLNDLYYISGISREGFVLRNMLVVSQNSQWYPIFMFAKDSTIVAYKFYLDRVRVKPKTEEKTDWLCEEFIGTKVRDTTGKGTAKGRIVKVMQRFYDGFPRIVIAQWDGFASLEVVLPPEKDEILMESLIFKCYNCHERLKEPYDPVEENTCPHCNAPLWKNVKTLPEISEPREIVESYNLLEKSDYPIRELFRIEQFEEERFASKSTNSKFSELERINWGASPGARKLMIGNYFTKMRLYRVDQPTVAQYLSILKQSKGLTLTKIIKMLPKKYKHTVGHWFRKDFGGSTPIPEDIELLKKVMNSENNFLSMLQRTILKFQTVKASVKGKNPGDFIEYMSEEGVRKLWNKTFSHPIQCST